MKYPKFIGLLFFLLLAVVIPGRAQPGPWGFNTYTNSTASPNAQGFLYNIAAGNLDGSGRTTVISANDTHSALSVFTNDGAGNLRWSYDYHPPNCVDPWGITLATNLLGDGKVAVVYADGGDNNLTILTNSLVTGLGVYQQLPAGSGSFFLNVVSNLVGDGRFALVAQNYDGNTLTVFTNNGAGKFGQFALIKSGGKPYGLSAGDFYHTGRPALACANYTDKSLTIYSYQGASPHFITNATYALPDYPNNVSAVSNLVGDHLFSLAVVLQTNVLILTNNGTGPFGSNATLKVGFGSGNVAGYVTAADLYGRGHLDLVVSPYESAPTVVVFTNTGAGRFNVCQTLANGSPSQAIVASVDGTTNVAIIAGDDAPKLNIWRQVTPPPAPLTWTAPAPMFYGAPLSAVQLDAYSVDANSFIPGTFTYSPTNGTVLPVGTNVLTVLFTPFADTNYSPATTQVEQVVIAPDRIQTGPWGYNTLTASTTTTNDQGNMYNIAGGNLDGSGRTTVVSANFGYGTLSVFTNDGVGNLNWSYDLSPANCYQPWGIILATNLLGDGRVAVVYADDFRNNLTILTNNPVTGLGVYQQLPTGSEPYFFNVVSNLVGDGRFTLVAQNYNDSTLTVFTNNGTGKFGQFDLIKSGSGPFGLTTGDFYHTGRPALACANENDKSLTIYSYQSAAARFITNATYALPDYPNNVSAVSNLLGDQQFSLAVVLQTNVLILTNNGSGTFGSNTVLNVSLGSTTGYVTAADLYGRGHLDLVVSPYESGSAVQVFTNTGAGGFKLSQTLTGAYPSQAVVASLDGTTNVAIISGDSNPNLDIWSQVAPPPAPLTWDAPAPIFYGAPLTASQLNAYSFDSATVSFILGTFTYSPANGTILPVGTNLLTVVFTPFAYTNYSPATTQVEQVVIAPDRIQTGPWGYNTQTYSTSSTNDQYNLYNIAAGNLDGSGRTTVVSANFGYGALSVFTNDGAGNLNWSYDLYPANCDDPWGITLATNLLGDGRVVVVYVDNFRNNLTILTNNPVTGLGIYQQLPTGSGPYLFNVVSNLVGDGRFALVAQNYDDNTLTVFTNNGAGKFGQFGLINSGSGPFGLTAGDFYHTGRPALACGNDGDKTLTIYSYQGASAGFITNATYALSDYPYNVLAVSNLVGDHQFSLALVFATQMQIWTNDGSGTFGSNATLNVDVGSGDVAGNVTAADLYGRGHLDLVVSPYQTGAAVQVFTNTGAGRFKLSQTLAGGSPSQAVVASLDGSTNVAIISGDFYPNLDIWTQVAPPPAPLTWTAPTPIFYGAPLSAFQLSAHSSVPGTYTYTPASGTVLPPGTNVLTVLFTPFAYTNYSPAIAQVEQVVLSADRIQPGPWGYNNLTYSTASTNDQGLMYTIAAGNLDGSGRTTVVSANDGGALSVFTNDGVGNLNWSYDFAPANCSEPYAITMATNLLGDGKVAVVYVDADKYNNLTILTNNPVTGLGVYQQLPTGNLPNALVVVSNLVATGQVAIVAANSYDNTLTVYTNNSAGKFGQFDLIHSGKQPYGLAAGDFYHTGRPALACANISGKSVTIYSYQGVSSGFITNATYAMPALTYNVSAVSNLFGDHQFALTVALPTEVLILTNNGSGTFGSNATLNASLVDSPGFVTAADVYGRGHLDLVVSPYEYGSAVQVFTNTGTGGFNLSQTLTGTEPAQAVVASLNGSTNLAIIAGSDYPNLNIWSQVAPLPAPISWTNPTAIIYPTPLSTNQLNATSSVPGTFTYTPANGTVLPVGTHVLSVVFSPADAINYNSVATNVTINVLPFQILSFYVAHDRNFTLNFNAGLGWIVEGSTNLVQWLPLLTNPPGSTFPYQFIDLDSTNHPYRFYRIFVP